MKGLPLASLPLLTLPLLQPQLSGQVVAPPLNGTQVFKQPEPDRQAPYRVLDRVEGAYVNTNEVAVRPLCRDPRAGGGLWSVNTHRSTVERFVPGVVQAVDVFPTPASPVAIAVWGGTADDTGDDELLVSCAGSSGLLRLSLTGELKGFLPLPAGPRDVLIDNERNLAFVACALADSVAQIDLGLNEIVRTYDASDFFAKKPTFLSFTPNGDVLVAPLLSGNNTTSSPRGTVAAGDLVLDLTDPLVADLANGGDLPDQDLFRIDPIAETITPVMRGLGTILFAHGVHPGSGALWMLNTDAINQDPNRQTEPSINGEFSRNRLTIAGLSGGLSLVPNYIDLDQRDTQHPSCATGDCPIDPEKTVGQPYQLSFGPGGEAYICGLLTDNIMILDASGSFVDERNLPDGSIPRGLLVQRAGAETFITVHCFGTNQLRTYRRSDLALVGVHELTPDLMPQQQKDGRAIFYDASKSRDNNASCATCHVEMETDFLVWNLSAGPSDDKGPMMTQTLAGIERMAPFHWRGERPDLSDFNPAFAELLGGVELDETPGSEFDAFEAFVFSVQVRPNPRANPSRVLDASIAAPTQSGLGDAVRGQNGYFVGATFGVFTCNDCHQMPLGTNNDDFQDLVLENRPKRGRFNVAPFHGMEERADMPRDSVLLWNDPTDPSLGTTELIRAALGAGTSHAGQTADLETFVNAVGNIGNNAPTLAEDITAFVSQFDTGIAGSAVQARYLDAGSTMAEKREVEILLVGQARMRNCSVAVLGEIVSTSLPGSPIVTRRWSFDPFAGAQGLFSCEDPAEGTRTYLDFIAGLSAGEKQIFHGLPVGMSERFATDADLDGVRDAVDPDPETPMVDANDQTPPSFQRGPEAIWTTTQLARIVCDTDEPTRLNVSWNSPTEGVLHERSFDLFSKTHSFLISDLLPSTLMPDGAGNYGPLQFSYDVEVTAFDRAGNQVSAFTNQPVITKHFIDADNVRQDHILSSLVWTVEDSSGVDPAGMTRFRGDVVATAAFRLGGPPAVPAEQRVIAARVLVNGIVSETAVPIGTRTFKADQFGLRRDNDPIERKLADPGPYLVTIDTDPNGEALLKFQQDGLLPGDVVELEISAVVELSADRADELTFFLDGVETTACTAGASPPDADCDGDGTPECCRLDVLIPRNGAQGIPQVHAGRRFVQWSFPRTPAHARKVQTTIP